MSCRRLRSAEPRGERGERGGVGGVRGLEAGLGVVRARGLRTLPGPAPGVADLQREGRARAGTWASAPELGWG